MIIRPGMASHVAAQAKAKEVPEPTASAPGTARVAATGGASQMPLGKIQVLSGPGAGKELELKKALITLG